MHISSISVSGFQCFGRDEITSVDLSPQMTALIGSNGTGKTALLQAMLRLFGGSQTERRVRPEDFHVSPDESIDDEAERELWIGVRIEFPELVDGENDVVAPFFQHEHVVADPVPFLRARLYAKWTRDNTLEGSIEERVEWMQCPTSTITDVPEEKRSKMEAYQRDLIRVEYIPAQRDVVSQIRRKTGSVVGKLIRAVEWSAETEEAVTDATGEIRSAVSDEAAIQMINVDMQERWRALHDGMYDQNPTLHVVEDNFRELVRNVDVSFQPTPTDNTHGADRLSDGLRSLFYLSLLVSYHQLVQGISRSVSAISQTGGQNGDGDGDDDADITHKTAFDHDRLQIPSLVIFALEEPENHLAPYYLSRIIGQLRDLTSSNRLQSVITSHSASTLSRIKPREVRYFRLEEGDQRTTSVQSIPLPESSGTISEGEVKYVRGAIQAFPELYFARFIVFAEGDSEEIVIPRLASALGYDFDPSFVAVVPLGGRHVNHFWRLASDLGIPHATLLDLDLGRGGAGWKRVTYALEQLMEGSNNGSYLKGPDGSPLTDEQIDQLAEEPYENLGDLETWARHLEQYDVYYSEPLDLDWIMLTAFTDAYRESANSPRSTNPTAISSAQKNVFGSSHSERYSAAQDAGFYTDVETDSGENFVWYNYLFKNKSKPTTHLWALAELDDDEIEKGVPDTLKRLIEHVQNILSQ